MDALSYKTISANRNTVQRNWVLVDAENQPLGRVASKVAGLLRGKHKTNYTPHTLCGDRVVVINAEKVVLTGKKMDNKTYVRYTGYPGGQRFTSPREMFAKFPTRVLEKAVRGMLPKTRLGSDMFRNMHLYVGTAHPHEAQQPKLVNLSSK